MPHADPIRHVIVLMMENRSFDHMLGGLAEAIPGLDGVNKPGEKPNFNVADGRRYYQEPHASRAIKYDPKHELEHTLNQLKKNTGGFVDDFVRAYSHLICYPDSVLIKQHIEFLEDKK
jgi:phospholipase C